MNKNDKSSQARLQLEEVREIPRWSRTYAQNRTLPIFVLLVVYLLICWGIGQFSRLAGEAYRAGHMLVFGLRMAALVVCLGAIVPLVIPSVFRRLMGILKEWCYPKEGYAIIAPSLKSPLSRRRVVYFSAFLMMIGVPAQALLGTSMIEKYQQPVSALYVVPFLLALALSTRPTVASLALLWPFLYSLHAVLLLAGVPILFPSEWSSLDMIVPTIGYGMLSALVGHAYNRHSLWRLRRLGAGGRGQETGGPGQA